MTMKGHSLFKSWLGSACEIMRNFPFWRFLVRSSLRDLFGAWTDGKSSADSRAYLFEVDVVGVAEPPQLMFIVVHYLARVFCKRFQRKIRFSLGCVWVCRITFLYVYESSMHRLCIDH